jgi:hypothetical protein
MTQSPTLRADERKRALMCDGMDVMKEFFIKKAQKERKLMHKEFPHSAR